MIKLFELYQPPEVEIAISQVLKSGRYVKGPLAIEFARVWAARCGMKYGVSVGSGAQALELAIRAVFGDGRSTITYTPHTFKAVPNAIRLMGHIAIGQLYEPMLYAHHIHDHKLDYVPFLEDCSHCHGVEPVAETAIFSLFPAKILGAVGEAGVIVTNNTEVFNLCSAWANHGEPDGTNARMDEIQAAALLVKLPYLDQWIQRRREIAKMYDDGLKRHTPGGYHYMYCIDGNQATVDKLISLGIESKLVYNEPYVALPFYPQLTNRQVLEIIRCVTQL